MLVHGQNLEDSTEMKDHDVYDVCLTRDEIQECVDTVNTVVNREIAMAKCEWGEGVWGVSGCGWSVSGCGMSEWAWVECEWGAG